MVVECMRLHRIQQAFAHLAETAVHWADVTTGKPYLSGILRISSPLEQTFGGQSQVSTVRSSDAMQRFLSAARSAVVAPCALHTPCLRPCFVNNLETPAPSHITLIKHHDGWRQTWAGSPCSRPALAYC